MHVDRRVIVLAGQREGQLPVFDQSKAHALGRVNAVDRFATHRLFAQKAFIAGVLESKPDEGGFFSNLLGFLGSGEGESDSSSNPLAAISGKFMLQAQAAQVFSEINAIKVSSLQHYMIEGEWPDSLATIGFSQSLFDNSENISYVNLQPDGSIVVELKESFGNDKVIVLSPDVQNTGGLQMNRWYCSSNLDQAYIPRNCETM